MMPTATGLGLAPRTVSWPVAANTVETQKTAAISAEMTAAIMTIRGRSPGSSGSSFSRAAWFFSS